MKKRTPLTIEEMFEAPEGEWHLLSGGFDLEVAEDLGEADSKQLVVAEPKRALRAIGQTPRAALAARGKSMAKQPAPKQPKRRSRRAN